MNNTIKAKKEERAQLVAELQNLSDAVTKEQRAFSPDEQNKFDTVEGRINQLNSEIETLARLEKVDGLRSQNQVTTNYAKPRLSYEERNDALRAHFLTQAGLTDLVKPEWRQCYEKAGLVLGSHSPLNVNIRATSGQNIADSIDGGYTVNSGLVVGLEKALKDFGGVTSVCRNLVTTSGSPIAYATNDDTSNSGAIVQENASVSNTAMVFGQVTLGAYKFSSLVNLVSLELIQDSSVDIQAEIASTLGTRLGRAHASYAAVGTGSGQPQGIVAGASAGKTAASTTAITAEELIDLYHSVDVAYRNLPGTCWMMNDSTYAAVRKLRFDSGNGGYLFGAGLNSAGPDSIMGKNVVIVNEMPSLGAGNKCVLFGNPSAAYVWRTVSNIQIRTMQEKYIENGAIAFIAFSRADGKTINASAMKYLANAAS